MSGISSGASRLDRAIAGYTEKTQISLRLFCTGACFQTSESGSAKQIYYWLRVKRVGLRRLAACGQGRPLRTFLTRAGISFTSLAHSALCGLHGGHQAPSRRALNELAASQRQPFSLGIPIGHGSLVGCGKVYILEHLQAQVVSSGASSKHQPWSISNPFLN